MVEKNKITPRSCRSMVIIILVIVILIGAKGSWVSCATIGHGSFEGEKNVVKSLIEQLECNLVVETNMEYYPFK